jgi:hypothetical protein
MSWLIFILSRQPDASPLLSETPFILFIVWAAWLFESQRRSITKNLSEKQEITQMID